MKCPVSESYTIRMQDGGEDRQFCPHCSDWHTPLSASAKATKPAENGTNTGKEGKSKNG